MTTEEADFSSGSLDDPQLYPRVYKYSYAILLARFVFVLTLCGFLIFVINPYSILFFIVIAAVALNSIIDFIHLCFHRIMLTYNEIEVTTIFSFRSIHRDALSGKRITYSDVSSKDSQDTLPRPETITLVPKNPGIQPLKFSYELVKDKVFEQWLASLPDITEQEQAAAVDAILADPALGENKEKRAKQLAFVRSIAKNANFAAVVICFGAWIYMHVFAPHLAIFAVIAVMPPLALINIIMFKRLYIAQLPKGSQYSKSLFFDVEEKDQLPKLSAVLVAPSLFLLSWALEAGPAILDWLLAVLNLIAKGFVVGGFVWWLRMQTPALPASIIMYAVIWSSSLVFNCNYLCDTSKPTVYRTTIISKKRDTSSWRLGTYVIVTPWGTREKANRIYVNSKDYLSYSRGEDLCITLHKGAFGVPWYDYDICSNGAKTPVLDWKKFYRPQ